MIKIASQSNQGNGFIARVIALSFYPRAFNRIPPSVKEEDSFLTRKLVSSNIEDENGPPHAI